MRNAGQTRPPRQNRTRRRSCKIRNCKNFLGTFRSRSYSGPVIGFLRFVAIINAAIWFGAAIFFAAGVLPAVFSTEMHQLFHENTAQPFYSGAVAQALFQRYFALQCICGAVALIHLVAEKLYLGRAMPRLGTSLVAALFCFGLIGSFWLLPHMKDLRQTAYFGRTPEEKEHARHSFAMWHGFSEVVNVFIIAGLLVHLVRVARPAVPGRYGSFYQIP
jgi:hypothetical protein